MLKLYENIKSRRIELGMTQSQLAEKLGYADKSMIAKIEKGAIDLQQSKIIAFAKALKIKPSDLMGWDDSPIFESAAGEGRINDGYPTEEYKIHLEADEFISRVRGRSMEPTLMDGDVVVITAQNVPDHDGQICLVRIDGEKSALKRVQIILRISTEYFIMTVSHTIKMSTTHY